MIYANFSVTVNVVPEKYAEVIEFLEELDDTQNWVTEYQENSSEPVTDESFDEVVKRGSKVYKVCGGKPDSYAMLNFILDNLNALDIAWSGNKENSSLVIDSGFEEGSVENAISVLKVLFDSGYLQAERLVAFEWYLLDENQLPVTHGFGRVMISKFGVTSIIPDSLEIWAENEYARLEKIAAFSKSRGIEKNLDKQAASMVASFGI
jgi:hypothetical protein